jgi:hypothetical protein
VDKRHTENQQANNCGQTPHRKPTIKSTLTPLKEGIKDKQLWTKHHTENQQTNNCGQKSHRKPIDKQLWTNVTETNRQTTVDKRHTENQQTNNVDKRHTENEQRNNCGQTSHRKPTEKQLWTKATQKTNRQTTVGKRHTENQ